MDERTALEKIEDFIKGLLDAKAELDDWEITVDPNAAIENESEKTLLVASTGFRIDNSAFCQGQSTLSAVIELAAISGPQPLGVVNRANYRVLAHAHAAIAADRTLGGRVEDLQERDVQPIADEFKEVHAATLQYDVIFNTPRENWFQIIGQGGATF